MAGKGLVAKSTAMLLVSLAAICYCGAVLTGHLSKERRLGPSELGILLLAAAVCIVLRWPHLVDRISAIKVAGLDVALREIEDKQKEQNAQLEAIRLFLPLLLPEAERAHLFNLVNGGAPPYTGSGTLRTELRHLRSIRLIQMLPGKTISGLADGQTFSLSSTLELTTLGREWLQRISELS